MRFRDAFDLFSATITHHGRRWPRGRRLRLEPLEDRRLLTLDPAVNVPLESAPLDLVAGDFDGDGVIDLATIRATQLSLLLGRGDGTFQAVQNTPVGPELRYLAAGDFNADGRLDLAMTASVTSFNGASYVTEGLIHVLLNDRTDAGGNVLFQPVRTSNTGANTTPGAIAVGDLNGDGQLDAAAAQTGGGNLTVLMGNGDGGFRSGDNFRVGSDPASVAVGDLNGDGRLDLVTANRWSVNVSVLLNAGNDTSGNATFQPAHHLGVNGNTAASVALGDFNADGRLDVGTTSSSLYYGYYGGYYGATGYVNVLLGNGDGTFAAATSTWANSRRLGELATADFNGDGHLDVVTPDALQVMAVDPTVLLGRGDGTFDAPYHFQAGNGPVAVVAADLNTDRAPDVAVANFYSGDISVLLNDRDWPPLGAPFVFLLRDVEVFEGDTGTTSALFTVSLTAPSSAPISVDFSTTDGTAVAGIDFQAAAGTLTFHPDGPLSQTVAVTIYGDRVLEAYSDSFYLNLSNPQNARIHGPENWAMDGQATAWIRDDEPGAVVYGAEVVEGHSGVVNAVFTISTASATEPLTVEWSTRDGTARAGSDYQASSGMVTFQPGGPTLQTVTVPLYGDRLGEYEYGSEYFYVTLKNGSTAYGVIVEDEPVIGISENVWQSEQNSGTTSFVYTVSLSQAYDQPVSVNFSTAEGDTHFEGGASPYGYYYYSHTPAATSGTDFQPQSGTLNFAPGETRKTVTVAVIGDRHAEQYEYFSVDLSNQSPNASLGDDHALGAIMDDEPQIMIESPQIVEGNSGTTHAIVTVSMASAADGPVTVDWSTVDGSALAGVDYQAASGALTFQPGGALTQTITLSILGDRVAEYDEAFSIHLSAAQSYVTIVDNEPRISISYYVGVNEGNTGTSNAVFVVSLAQPYDEPVTVDFSTSEGGDDFQTQSGTVTIAAGQTSANITVAVYGDTIVEETEYFAVYLTGASHGAIIYNSYGTGVIIDDDTPPAIVIDDAAIVEGASGTRLMVFTVSLSQASGNGVWVNYATANGSAQVSDNDYVGAAGTIYFAPGETVKTITVSIKGDTRKEKDEHFYLNLSAAIGGEIVDGQGVGTILNDDGGKPRGKSG